MPTDDPSGPPSPPALETLPALGASHPTWAEQSFVGDDRAPEPVSAPALVDDQVTGEAEGRYLQLEELGRGGMGRVWLTEDQHLHRRVARKELRVASPGLRERFLREARITAQLQHPGIVAVHELGRAWDDGRLYYTMDRVRGRTLAEALDGAQSAQERLALLGAFVEVCQAVAFAHSKGVIHRDLKPDNVMIGPFGETIVLDWGLARVAGEVDLFFDPVDEVSTISGDSHHTRAGAVLGTARYMSPEQARGGEVDARSDVWSLGATLYELLSGSTPFEGPTQLVLQHVRESLVSPPPVLPAGTPPELVAIAMKALERLPEDRYPDAASLAADVEAFRTGAAVSAHTYSALDQVRRAALQRRTALAAVFAAALAGAVTAASLSPRMADRTLTAQVAGAHASAAEELLDALELERTGHRSDALARVRLLLAQGGLDPAVRARSEAARARLVAGGADVRVLSTEPATGLAWSGSGNSLAWVRDRQVLMADPANGLELGRVEVDAPVTALAFTAGADPGLLVATADGVVTRVGFRTGEPRPLLTLEAPAQALLAPPGAPFAVALLEGRVDALDPSGERLHYVQGPVLPPLLSASGVLVATATGVERFDLYPRPLPRLATGPVVAWDAASGPSGRAELVVAGDDGVSTWSGGTLLHRWRASPEAVALSPNGARVALVERGRAALLDVDGSVLRDLGGDAVGVLFAGDVPVVVGDGWARTEAQRFDGRGRFAAGPGGRELALTGPEGVFVWQLRPEADAPLTNLRACSDGRVVPVIPFPSVDRLTPPGACE